MSNTVLLAAGGAFAVVLTLLLWPGLVPMQLLSALQLSTLFALAFGSRLPQIVLNWRRGNSG